MIASAAEFDAAKAMVAREVDHMARHGYQAPYELKLGAMVEVPSLLWELDELASRADFLSVGSNDLMQYLFAVDRDNKRVATRFDALSPAMLRALGSVAAAGHRHGIPVTLCGEFGGKPLGALALVALGYRNLSMSASSLGPVKAMLLGLDAADASAYVGDLLASRDGAASLRPALTAYAERHSLPL